MPDPVTIISATVATDDFTGKGAVEELPSLPCPSADLLLYQFKGFWRYDRVMGVADVPLFPLAFIHAFLLRQEINDIGFLESSIALVFFVPQY